LFLSGVLLLTLFVLEGLYSAAAVNYFLKIDGIMGESQDRTHQGEIQLESWTWGGQQSGGSESMAAGKSQMQPFQFIMNANKASLPLFLKMATGNISGVRFLPAGKLVSNSRIF